MLLRIIITVMLSVFPTAAKKIDKEILCLAKNIFFEAGNQSIDGKMAVAWVTYNRKTHQNYPKTYCKVVYQPYQFAWTRQKHKKLVYDWRWDDSLFVAQHFKLTKDITKGSIFFHETSIRPYWTRRLTRVIKIQKHIFYTLSKYP